VSPLLFANLSKLTLSETQEGGAIAWPKLVPGFDLCATLRLTKTLEGAVELSRRTLVNLKATIGEVDARPTSGTIQIKVGSSAESAGVNTTAAIAYSATAAEVATALNALSGPTSLKPFTVVERDASWIVRAAAGAQTTLTVVDNDLWPSSRVDIREFTFDEAYSYELRLCQVPVAEVTNFNSVVPPVPTVTQVRAGADNTGVLTSEIQKVYVPPENPEGFAFALKKGFKRSDPITNLVVEDVQAAVAKLYDLTAGEELRIFEGDNGFLVEFLGDAWLGFNQDMLEVEVVNEARADVAFRLITATNEMAVRMRNVPTNGEVKLPLEVTLGLENEQNAALTDYIIFRSELTFVRPVSMARFSAAAALNWNTPLTRESYLQFSPSQVATGQRHYLISTAIGNGSATVFNVDHNLGTRYLLVQLQESAVDGEFLILGTDYDVEIVTDNRIKITFAVAPAAASVLGQITSAAHSANFQAHTHTIADVTGLEARLSALEENVTELQALVPSGSLGSSTQISSAPTLSVVLPLFVEAYPAINPDLVTEDSDYKSLAEIPLSALPQNGGLLPAVHDAAVETLPSPVPSAADAYKGRVFRNASPTASVELDGGYGRRGVTLRPGEFAACDGRSWYPVKRYDSSATVTPKVFTVTTATDVCASTAHGFANGAAVLVSSATTLPAPLLPDVQYFVRDVTTDSFKLAATAGGAAIDLTTTGTGAHSIIAAPKTTFYPVDFERELFILPISAKQFRIKKTLTVQAGIETALVHLAGAAPRGGDWRLRDQRSTAQWSIVMRWGTLTSESSPATTGANLKGISWNATPILEHRINLVQSPMVHTFGCRIKRTAESTFTTEEILYGLASTSASAVASADLVLGAWLERFDTNDGVSDPRGLALLMGLARSNDEAETLGTLTLN
jgi:hypothetical protein